MQAKYTFTIDTTQLDRQINSALDDLSQKAIDGYIADIDIVTIRRSINKAIDDIFNEELETRWSSLSDMLREAAKDMVYSRKDEIVEKVVNRATTEIVKRGLPKLLTNLTEEARHEQA